MGKVKWTERASAKGEKERGRGRRKLIHRARASPAGRRGGWTPLKGARLSAVKEEDKVKSRIMRVCGIVRLDYKSPNIISFGRSFQQNHATGNHAPLPLPPGVSKFTLLFSSNS